MRASLHVLAVALLVSAATAARAGPSVWLNGVSIDGVTNQRFENCDVTIDGQGNIHIEAKGYSVRVASATPQPPPPTPPGEKVPLARRYFLVTERSQEGEAQYDVAVFINSKWIRDLKSSEGQVVMELTKHLRPGSNHLVFAATKRTGSGGSKDGAFKIIVGEGRRTGDEVAIESPLFEVVRRGSETEDVTEEKNLLAR